MYYDRNKIDGGGGERGDKERVLDAHGVASCVMSARAKSVVPVMATPRGLRWRYGINQVSDKSIFKPHLLRGKQSILDREENHTREASLPSFLALRFTGYWFDHSRIYPTRVHLQNCGGIQ